MTENSLALLSRATQMLAEVKTIDDAKYLMDIASAAKHYAQKHKLGKDAVNDANTIKISAEIKLGEILKNMEKADGGDAQRTRLHKDTESPPTLRELDISKRESVEAQMLASLSKEEQEKVKVGKVSKNKAIKKNKKKEKQEVIKEQAKKYNPSENCILKHCSLAELLPTIKPDAIITDPPYGKEHLKLYSDLASLSADVPIVAVMCGQSYLPKVLEIMTAFLSYRWTLAYLTPGGQSPQIWERKINTFWKPILLFGKNIDWVGDVVKSEANDNDKRFHDWGQSASGMSDLIKRLTKPNDLICDPFLGGGTTAVVSVALQRRFVGCDIDKNCIEITKGRIAGLCLR